MIGRVQLTPRGAGRGYGGGTAIVRPEEYRPVDYKLIPTAVFSLPNIGTVGLTEGGGAERRAQGEDLREPLPADEADLPTTRKRP